MDRKIGVEKKIEKLIAENFQNLMKNINLILLGRAQ